MPTLTVSSTKQRFSETVDSQRSSRAVALGNKVLSSVTPAAADGNSIDDHLSDIKARLSHFTNDTEFKGVYDNSATYAIGDEVYWINGDGHKVFYKRLTAGTDGGSGTPVTHTSAWTELTSDIHNLDSGDYNLTENESILERLPNGVIRFNRRLVSVLNAAQTATEVTNSIFAELDKIADKSLWRGEWTPDVYSVGEYAKHSGSYFRCILARSSSDATGPASDTTGWTSLSGSELHIAIRLEDITNLLNESIGLEKASESRGLWTARRVNAEAWGYVNPPMQWKGNWSSSGNYFYGDVVHDDNRIYVLTATSTIVTPKSGAGTDPGTDNAWSEISVGHTSDVPGWRGEWEDLAGATLRQGDMVVYKGQYYIVKQAIASRGGSGPDEDSENYDLIDTWIGDYTADTWWPLGGIVKYNNQFWLATVHVRHDDPEPGHTGDTKWLQIGGVTTADFEQLRRDIADITHGSRTARGVLVEILEEPPNAQSEPEVWMAKGAERQFTIPSSQHAGNSNRVHSIDEEPGQYKLTSGTINRMTGVVGKLTTSDNKLWYGIFTRAEDGAPFAGDAGKIMHNPLGSGIVGVGVEHTTGSNWTVHLMIKVGILEGLAATYPNELQSIYIQVWNHSGTKQTDLHVNAQQRLYTFHNTIYRHITGTTTSRASFGNIFESGTNDATRTIHVGIAGSNNGSAYWLGNRQYAWTREPPIANTNNIPVFSEDVHQIRVMSRAEYNALTALPARTLIYIHGT